MEVTITVTAEEIEKLDKHLRRRLMLIGAKFDSATFMDRLLARVLDAAREEKK